jgi:hypothetical protein
MSYSANDQSDALIARLAQAGYSITIGNGWNTRQLLDGEGDDGLFADSPDLAEGEPDDYREDLDGAWFTWCQGGDVECGETVPSVLQAWTLAMQHWFDNATIADESAAHAAHCPVCDAENPPDYERCACCATSAASDAPA